MNVEFYSEYKDTAKKMSNLNLIQEITLEESNCDLDIPDADTKLYLLTTELENRNGKEGNDSNRRRV